MPTPAAPNPPSPERLAPGARLTEIGEILARGLVRLRARQSSSLSEDRGENSVDFSVDQRGLVAPNANVGDAE
jgi:hypothetical protein